MTDEQAGKLVDCIDYLINEIRRLRIDVAEGAPPSLAERVEALRRVQRGPSIVFYSKRRTDQIKGHDAVTAYIDLLEQEIETAIESCLSEEGITKVKQKLGWF